MAVCKENDSNGVGSKGKWHAKMHFTWPGYGEILLTNLPLPRKQHCGGMNLEIAQNRCDCLHGSEDIKWIHAFTINARKVAEARDIVPKMVYVGKSNGKEHVRKIITAIEKEQLRQCWPNLNINLVLLDKT
ncbi:hypothetical protein Ancab_035745 [Ancistrocladus abbreviatus]